MRKAITPEATHSLEERDIFYTAIVYVARLLTQNEHNVIIDATGNLRRYREQARRQIPRFMEAYVRCPLEVAIEREKAETFHPRAKGHIQESHQEGKSNCAGVGVPYEEPVKPELQWTLTSCDRCSVQANLRDAG